MNGLKNISSELEDFVVVNKVDVLILGAGVSGLSAAYTLKKHRPRLRIAVLEARMRIGGRMYTADLGNGLVGEYGAEWIGRTHKNIRRLCKALGISLEPHTYAESPPHLLRRSHTPDMTLSTALQKLEHIFTRWPNVRGKNFELLDHMSLRKFIAADCSHDEIQVLNELYSGEFGQDIRYVSAVRAVADHITGGKNSHMDFHIQGGNNKLTGSLAEYVGLEHIYLDHEVTRISQTKRDATVICQNGSIWSAKKIICTLPSQVLSQIHFKPTMSMQMRKTASSLKYGNIVKILLVFKERFWGAENYSQLSAGMTQYVYHATQGQTGKSGALCIYAVGKRAEALMHMSTTQIWDLLKNSFPSHITTKGIKPVQMHRHSWAHDRFSQGAYAVYHPSEWNKVQKYFGHPYNHIHFSGEHLAKMQGFMEGAVQTGISAAQAVLKELKK